MRRVLNVGMIVCFLLAGLFVTTAAWNSLLSGHITTEPAAVFLHDLSPGLEYPQIVVVRNGNRVPAKLVGANQWCGASGCVELEGLPLEIPAHASRSLVMRIKAGKPGIMVASIPIFTDDLEKPWITIPVNVAINEPPVVSSKR